MNMQTTRKSILICAKEIDRELRLMGNIPEEGMFSKTQQVIPFSVVRNSRGYIEKVVNQINGCYENGWFDACAVMIRRMLETLIIEVYEKYNLADKIKNQNGDFLFLGELINATLNETSFNLSRPTKKALPRFKDIGDKSAHSRRYNAHKFDIDKVLDDLRVTAQEFIYLSGLK